MTEDQILDEDRQGESLTVPIEVQNLDEAARINAVDLTLDFGSAPVDFVEFNTSDTLLDGWFTDQSDDGTQAELSGASNDPLGGGASSGILVKAVFEVTEQGSGIIAFPDVRFNDVNPPGADLSRADFSVTVGAALTIGEAREQGPGTSAVLEGTVTRAFGAYARFQDESGPTGASGLTLRQAGGPLSEDFQADIAEGTIAQGTELTVRGTLSERNGLLVIDGDDLASYSVTGQGPLPFPQPVSLFELEFPNGTDYESELLRVEGLSFDNPEATGGTLDSNTTYTIVDKNGTAFDYRVGSAEETSLIGATIPEDSFTYEGVLGRSEGRFALVPVRRSTGLPVELARFEATLSEKAATLTWQTASETDNAGFEVQHRPPGAGAWDDLGFIESSAEGGTTDTPQSYRFETAPLPPGEHRFRLRQVDLGGTATLSDTVHVEVRAGRTLSLTRTGPHPARTSTRFGVTTSKPGTATVTLYDALGRRVRRVWTDDVQAGTRHVVTVQVQDLPSGTYFARLTGPGGTQTRRLTVVQ